MYCKRCGFELPEDSIYCPNCGEKILTTHGMRASNGKKVPKHISPKQSNVSKKTISIYIAIIVFLLATIIVSCIFHVLRSHASSQEPNSTAIQGQSEDISSALTPIPEETQYSEQNSNHTVSPTLSPEPSVIPSKDIKKLVESLNEQAKEKPLFPEVDGYESFSAFQVGDESNTILLKTSSEVFTQAIKYAQNGDAESIKAYYRLLESFPSLESSLEKALQESQPEIDVVIVLMIDEKSSDVAAVFNDGKILYDIMNGSGTIPTGITPIENTSTAQLTPDTIAEIIAGQSSLPVEVQNKALVDYINNQTTNSSTQSGGLPFSQETRDLVNQTIDDVTAHVIAGQSDLPVEVQNKILINYIRSLSR